MGLSGSGVGFVRFYGRVERAYEVEERPPSRKLSQMSVTPLCVAHIYGAGGVLEAVWPVFPEMMSDRAGASEHNPDETRSGFEARA